MNLERIVPPRYLAFLLLLSSPRQGRPRQTLPVPLPSRAGLPTAFAVLLDGKGGHYSTDLCIFLLLLSIISSLLCYSFRAHVCLFVGPLLASFAGSGEASGSARRRMSPLLNALPGFPSSVEEKALVNFLWA